MIAVEQDFENEIERLRSWGKLPYSDLFLNDTEFRVALFDEFKALTPKVKATLYAYDFISRDELNQAEIDKEKGITESLEIIAYDELEHLRKNFPEDYKKYKSKSKEFAEFDESRLLKTLSIPKYKYDRIHNEWCDLVHKAEKMKESEIDKKYFARYLNTTPTIKTLNRLSEKLERFEKYVIKNNDNYKDYAETKANEVIEILNELNHDSLKNELLKKIKKQNSSKEIEIESIAINMSLYHHNKDISDLEDKYDTLKGYFNVVLDKELKNGTTSNKPANKTNPPKEVINTFDDAAVSKERLNEMLTMLHDKRLFISAGSTTITYQLKKGKGASLYSYIKRFDDDGYFKKMTGTKLHQLVNEKFKLKVIYQQYNQTPPYTGELE